MIRQLAGALRDAVAELGVVRGVGAWLLVVIFVIVDDDGDPML